MNPKLLIIDNHNYIDYPFGGPLTFARNLMRLLGSRVALVGTTNDPRDPIGRWVKKNIDGVEYDYFAYRRAQRSEKKPLLPNKVTDGIALLCHMRGIRSLGVRRIFVQIPDAMMAVAPFRWESICFRFTGVFNPVAFSKYAWGRPLGRLYEQMLFRALNNVDCILATADDRAIGELVARSRGYLQRERLHKFPTRVDLGLFEGKSREESRKTLGIQQDVPLFLYCARITWTKGWDLALEGFKVVAQSRPDALLLFVGGGEDVPALEQKIEELSLSSQVKVYGRRSREEVVDFYMAADVYCVASYIEGWSNSMLEALAAGCAVVSTDVSGAYDLIEDNSNGFVLDNRDSDRFGEAMLDSLGLQSAVSISREKSKLCSLETLLPDLKTAWPLLDEG